ncbi:RNA polymerase sigma factor [Salinicoccus sp. Marseille-QA3877]
MYLITQHYFNLKESIDDRMNDYAYKVYNGDISAFDWIDENLRQVIFKKTLKYPFDHYDREDALQDMMELALRLCYKYNPELGNYRHYVSKVITYELMKLYYRLTDYGLSEVIKSVKDITFETADHRNRMQDDPLDIIIYEENKSQILNNRKVCSPLERQIVYYCNYGYQIKEISEKLCVSEKVIVNSLHRVRRKRKK